MLATDDLDDATIERAGALVAREHAAARQVRPELPAGFDSADACAAALQQLRDSGHRGLVVTANGRTVAVMTATVRQHPAGGRYARLPAEGFAAEPDLADPTGVLAAAFADLASPLVAGGVLRYYLLHTALPRLAEALSNLGFGRDGAYAIQPAAPRRTSSAVAVRAAVTDDLDSVARLALIEIQHRSAAPMFAPPHDPPLAGLAARHRALHDNGAVHLIATLDGRERRPAHHRADLTGTTPVPGRPAPTSAPPPPCPARAGKASATPSSPPRSPGTWPPLPVGPGRFRDR